MFEINATQKVATMADNNKKPIIGRPTVHPRHRKRTLPLRVSVDVARFLVAELTEWATQSNISPRTWKLRDQLQTAGSDVMLQIPLALPGELMDRADKLIAGRLRTVRKTGVSVDTMEAAIRAGFHREMLESGQEQTQKSASGWKTIRAQMFGSETAPNVSEIACALYKLGLDKETDRLMKLKEKAKLN